MASSGVLESVESSECRPDANIDKIEIDYDEFTIHISESTSVNKRVHCLGYIGFQIVGFWDEMIIETAKIHSDHAFILDCESRIMQDLESGSKYRKKAGNRLLEVVLIDGRKLWICAREFRCDER
jgi:hypothetical protein